MKKKLTAGVIAGFSTLALAAPVFAQVSGSDAGQSSISFFRSDAQRPPATQEAIQAMIDADNAFLLNVDAFIDIQKAAVQTHRADLTATAAITDETERQEAVRAAHEAMRQTIKDALEANPDLRATMPMMKHARHGRHHGPGHLAQDSSAQ